MSKTNAFETGLLEVIFQNVVSNAAIAALGDGLRASITAGSLYVSLHSSDPGESGSQTSSEVAYDDYARVTLARGVGAWAVSGNTADNVAEVAFPPATGGSDTARYFGVGTAATGTGNLLYSGTVTPNLAISNGITPRFAAGDLNVTED